MQIKRLLDDKEVFAGSKVFDAQGRSYAFVEHSGGELVVTPEDGRHSVFLLWLNLFCLAPIRKN